MCVAYLENRNAIRISREGTADVEWRFKPKGKLTGVIMGDDAVLWTRSVEGRIIQMAMGTIQADGDGMTFVPRETIGTMKSQATHGKKNKPQGD